MRNIELKAHLVDRERAIRICKEMSGARFEGDIRQTDTYFKVPKGRFKLRVCEPGETYLVYYEREDATEAKGSDYHIEFARASVRDILDRALGTIAEVRKVRTLYLWENVRIHLDRVEELGDFIEFEAVLRHSNTEEEGYRKVAELKSLFGIENTDLIEGSYLEMVNPISASHEKTVAP
ncbi:MAG: class IV adenylate cyclase [Candidatus Omnitrophica bacterium]|nr:class IV adenylate cyclase [Candidatus Omnitrophota bacterium]